MAWGLDRSQGPDRMASTSATALHTRVCPRSVVQGRSRVNGASPSRMGLVLLRTGEIDLCSKGMCAKTIRSHTRKQQNAIHQLRQVTSTRALGWKPIAIRRIHRSGSLAVDTKIRLMTLPNWSRSVRPVRARAPSKIRRCAAPVRVRESQKIHRCCRPTRVGCIEKQTRSRQRRVITPMSAPASFVAAQVHSVAATSERKRTQRVRGHGQFQRRPFFERSQNVSDHGAAAIRSQPFGNRPPSPLPCIAWFK